MKEDFWNSLETYLKEEEKKKVVRKSRQVSQKEQIRRQLEERTRAELDKYNQQYQDSGEIAKEKIAQVIVPWWENDVIGSGLFARLLQWRKGRRLPNLALTDPITYPWPTKVLQELGSKSTLFAPFDVDAEFALESTNKIIHASIEQDIDGRVTRYFSETWKAQFFFVGPTSTDDLRLRIHYEPTRQPTGCGARHIAYDTNLVFEGLYTELPPIHPNVVNEFANQIESEQVWSRLGRSMQGKR